MKMSSYALCNSVFSLGGDKLPSSPTTPFKAIYYQQKGRHWVTNHFALGGRQMIYTAVAAKRHTSTEGSALLK